uniref:Uncharacterized protein n=1 Tax=Faecalibaculum rodentium TaxID=1702221 RepID=A0A140DXN9_9FIRM|nr:hypothetical protein AALO17_22820 [Faecalibaculum rodentium]
MERQACLTIIGRGTFETGAFQPPSAGKTIHFRLWQVLSGRSRGLGMGLFYNGGIRGRIS